MSGEEVRCVGKLFHRLAAKTDWESPLADGSKVEGWHDQLVGGRRSKSLSRWHISDLGEVGRQIRGRSAHRRSLLDR